MGFFSSIVSIPARLGGAQHVSTQVSKKLIDSAASEPAAALQQLNTTLEGLPPAEVASRLAQYGPNVVAREHRVTFLARLWDNVKNPLVLLLVTLAVISYLTQDINGAIIIGLMVLLGIVLRFVQESRADNAAARLKAMVSTTATVVRGGQQVEIPLSQIVPGDIVSLSAGDMVPGDCRLVAGKDLFLNQSALTGESMPVEKFPAAVDTAKASPMEIANLCLLGSNVESGSGTALVVLTGGETYFGSLAASIVGDRQLTSFDKGINQFTWLMISFMAVMVPLVFLFNGLTKGNWLQAFLFALAVAVGLTPEMLPMIVTVNLSRGALAMSKEKVIVKRLNAIQNFGAMDTLCTDKTGTLTEGHIVLERYLDVRGNDNEKVLQYGYLNSHFQTGLKNLLDVAVLDHVHLKDQLIEGGHFKKVDEIPFDFNRKRMSVIVEDENSSQHILICKGAVEEVMALCDRVDYDGQVLDVLPEHDANRRKMVEDLNGQGFRVIAIAYKVVPTEAHTPVYSVKDESDLVLLGFLAFLDPPKATAAEAIKQLEDLKVGIKILTGDNEIISRTVCGKVGLPVDNVLLGPAIEEMDETQLSEAAEKATVFAKLSPSHKERIIHALQKKGHVVGFMGDGINDAPALKAADVGVSVNSAVDIAKESSDIILLENSLLVLKQGVIEGRKVFGNITKYIKMAASSNFGNMFSMLGASLILPFIPMLPLQILTNNLLYDFSQTTIPTDSVDAEWLLKPRKWTISEIRRFILYIGPLSSIFDYLTYFIMLYVFNSWTNEALFHTGWFIESLFTQTLIIHVIRTNKIPFLQSRASLPLLLTSIAIVIVGALLPISPLAGVLGFVPLPPLYWLLLFGMLVAYVVLTQVVKTWFYKRFGD